MNNYSFRSFGSRWARVLVISLVLLLLIAGTGAFVVRRIYKDNLRPVSGSETSMLVTIEIGSSPQQIASQLETEGLIRKAWAFEWYVRNKGLREFLQAGTYSLKPSLSTQQIADVLTQGKIATDLVTILPGQRLDQIRDSLINYGFSQSQVDNALKADNYRNHPALTDKPRSTNLEGYLYPESFQKDAKTDPETIIRSSLDEMHEYLTPEVRAGITKQGYTVHEGVILASIVEMEVTEVKPEDRPRVAQVFLKRLRQGMKLESDATASYGAILDGVEPSLTYDSVYNTYIHDGLTPTPISNVSKTSLEAVANPAKTDFLYFVSGDGPHKGETYFSRTLSEHEENVAKYCSKCN